MRSTIIPLFFLWSVSNGQRIPVPQLKLSFQGRSSDSSPQVQKFSISSFPTKIPEYPVLTSRLSSSLPVSPIPTDSESRLPFSPIPTDRESRLPVSPIPTDNKETSSVAPISTDEEASRLPVSPIPTFSRQPVSPLLTSSQFNQYDLSPIQNSIVPDTFRYSGTPVPFSRRPIHLTVTARGRAPALVNIGPNLDDLQENEWNAFKLTYNKVYYTEEEERFRREIFMENRIKINRFNEEYAQGLSSFFHKMNPYGDMLHHEFTTTLNGYNVTNGENAINNPYGSTFIPSANVLSPNSIDWRELGAVTPVKNQGKCAACYAFAAAGALEGQHFRKTGVLQEVSAQHLIDCTTPYGTNGCTGGLMNPTFQYVKDIPGANSENIYPYEEKQGECRHKPEDIASICTGYVDIAQNDEKQLEVAVASIGPVAAAIDAGRETLQFYSDGIYDDPECGNTPEKMNHAVLIVGFGKEPDGRSYWLVKNSYGPRWGLGGYIKIAKDNNNQCGISVQASYPLV